MSLLYHSTVGHYSEDDGYFTASGVDNSSLHALANGVSGPNGVYSYGASSVFPNQTWSAANYWVDVVFLAGPAASLPAVTVSPVTSNAECGSNVVLTANATGAGTLSYQWSDNQTNLLSGETGQTLRLIMCILRTPATTPPSLPTPMELPRTSPWVYVVDRRRR